MKDVKGSITSLNSALLNLDDPNDIPLVFVRNHIKYALEQLQTFLDFPGVAMVDDDMKTENLNFQHACAAIGRGEFVQTPGTAIFGPKGYWDLDTKDKPFWNLEHGLFCDSVYRIVPDPSKQAEEKPSLTYEQALECERVAIKYPHIDRAIIHSREYIWKFDDLLYCDLAERRGYRMEKVD